MAMFLAIIVEGAIYYPAKNNNKCNKEKEI